jgi:hypothetical protein
LLAPYQELRPAPTLPMLTRVVFLRSFPYHTRAFLFHRFNTQELRPAPTLSMMTRVVNTATVVNFAIYGCMGVFGVLLATAQQQPVMPNILQNLDLRSFLVAVAQLGIGMTVVLACTYACNAT